MSAVLLAVFNEHAVADRVRTQLVSDGFPTDRVELTSTQHLGKAQVEPATSRRAKFAQYFQTLFGEESERQFVDALVDRIDHGAAAVAVHPRGNIETARAAEILTHAGAVEMKAHDLQDQFLEQAASREQGYWVRHLLPETLTGEQ
jgi:hypothetical protein